jgi:hypothetical protein
MVTEVAYTHPNKTTFRAVVDGVARYGSLNADTGTARQVREWIAAGNIPAPYDPVKYPVLDQEKPGGQP